MMEAIFFALISFLCWGTGDIFATIVSRKLGSYSANIWASVFKLIVFSVYIPFAISSLSQLTLESTGMIAVLSIVLAVANLSYNEGLRIANPSLVATISGSFIAVVVILSLIFLKESVTTYQILSIIVIFFGTLLSTLDVKQLRKGIMKSGRGIILATVTMLLWGVYFTFIKIPVNEVGWFWPTYLSALSFPFVVLFAKFRKSKMPNPNYDKCLLPFLLMVLITGIAEFSYNSAIDTGMTAVVAPIAGSYPVLLAILAYFIFRDPITRQQKIGIAISLLGIVSLSFMTA
jgi:drug/metabolite transporter (DMT)-like permease